MGHNGKLDGFVADIVISNIVEMPHIVPLLDDFVVLQRAEARLIKRYKNVLCDSPLLYSKERKYIV